MDGVSAKGLYMCQGIADRKMRNAMLKKPPVQPLVRPILLIQRAPDKKTTEINPNKTRGESR